MKRWILFVVLMLFVFVAGCALTDLQVKEISDSVGAATTAAATVAITAASGGAVSPEAAGGIASGIGGAVALLVAWILKSVRKTPPLVVTG